MIRTTVMYGLGPSYEAKLENIEITPSFRGIRISSKDTSKTIHITGSVYDLEQVAYSLLAQASKGKERSRIIQLNRK